MVSLQQLIFESKLAVLGVKPWVWAELPDLTHSAGGDGEREGSRWRPSVMPGSLHRLKQHAARPPDGRRNTLTQPRRERSHVSRQPKINARMEKEDGNEKQRWRKGKAIICSVIQEGVGLLGVVLPIKTFRPFYFILFFFFGGDPPCVSGAPGP